MDVKIKFYFEKRYYGHDNVSELNKELNGCANMIFFGLRKENDGLLNCWVPEEIIAFNDKIAFAYQASSLAEGIQYLMSAFEQGVALGMKAPIHFDKEYLEILFYGSNKPWWRQLITHNDGVFYNLSKFNEANKPINLPDVFENISDIIQTLDMEDYFTHIKLNVSHLHAMGYFDFRRRFIASLPGNLDLRLDEFIDFDPAVVSGLHSEDSAFLLNDGLPRDAAPFLHFEAYSKEQLGNCAKTFGLSEPVFPIGQNGSGDVVAIDLSSREVVYFNHDANNLRVFINSSLAQFAESLCIYQEHLSTQTMPLCLAAISASDAKAARVGTMWHEEVQAEVAGG